MKKHSYGKLISMSWAWMAQVLFRPFSLKKWMMLAIIIILAGQMGGGCNVNYKGGEKFDGFINEAKGEITLPQIGTTLNSSTGRSPMIVAIAIAIPIFLIILIFMLLWIWVSSNFSFVFIDSVMRNDASFRVPFHRNKLQGNSYFRWNVAFIAIVLLIFCAIIAFPITQLVRAGVFTGTSSLKAGQALPMVVPYALVFIISALLAFLIYILVLDFILPIMYKKKTGILKAWGIFLGLFQRNIAEVIKYIFLKIVLSIAALIASLILAVIAILLVLIIGGLLGLAGWMIYGVTPAAAKPIIIGIGALIGIPASIFLVFLFIAIFIPIPLFFRTFSIYVLGSMDESLDLFAPKTPEEITAEGDDAKYRKSMRLVWFTVLSPLLIAFLGVASAIAIPAFVKARGGPAVTLPKLEKITPGEGRESLPPIPLLQERAPRRKVVVYLKNGNSFEAEVERETEHQIAFRVKGGTFALPKSDIEHIEEKE